MIHYFKIPYCSGATSEQEPHACLQRLKSDHLRLSIYLKRMTMEEYYEEPAMTVRIGIIVFHA